MAFYRARSAFLPLASSESSESSSPHGLSTLTTTYDDRYHCYLFLGTSPCYSYICKSDGTSLCLHSWSFWWYPLLHPSIHLLPIFFLARVEYCTFASLTIARSHLREDVRLLRILKTISLRVTDFRVEHLYCGFGLLLASTIINHSSPSTSLIRTTSQI